LPYKEDTETGLRLTNDYSIKRLWGIHKQICKMHVLGSKGSDIAAYLGVTPQTVYNVLGSDRGKQEIARLSGSQEEKFQEIQERLEQLAPFALDTLEEALLASNEEVTIPAKIGVAKDLLDRAGHKPVSQVSINSVSAKVDAEFLKEVKARAQEIKQEMKQSEEITEAVVVSS